MNASNLAKRLRSSIPFRLCIAAIVSACLLDPAPGATQTPSGERGPAVVGLDHIPIAVHDLPASRQLVPGRRIVGASLRVRSLDAVRKRLASREIPVSAAAADAASLFLSPAVTHGLWIEFRDVR